jgi:hypothetical protein
MGMTKFVQKPDEADETWTVHHKNNNSKNNNADNLIWASLSTQSKEQRSSEQIRIDSYPVIGTALNNITLLDGVDIEKGDSKLFDNSICAAKQINGYPNSISNCITGYSNCHAGFSWKTPPNDENLPNEIWYSIGKNHKHERFISFYGRLKYKFYNEYEKIIWAKDMLTNRCQREKDLYPNITTGKKTRKFHHMVLEIIIDIPINVVVDHIDDVKSNARLGNLQLLTQKENTKKRHIKKYTSSIASFIDKKHELSHASKESAIEYVCSHGYPLATIMELNIELMFLKICDIPAIIYGRTWIPAHFTK